MAQGTIELSDQHCTPCEGGEAPLKKDEINHYQELLKCSWQIVDDKKLRHEFSFNNFDEAMFFVNEVAAVAEGEGHHPDIHVFFKKVVIELWTHAIGGLSVNDFILASKIERCED